MKKLLFIIAISLTACEPFNLARRDFPTQTCTTPAASIGFRPIGLDVEFSAENITGDFGQVVIWSLGDGASRNIPINKETRSARFTYRYDRPGTYTVSASIPTSCRDNEFFTRTLTVEVRNP